MSFTVPYQHNRKNIIAMEEFCQLMETPMFFQQQRGVHHHQPHLTFYDNSSREPQMQHHFLSNDSFGTCADYTAGPQYPLSFSKAYGTHAHHTLEPHLSQESQFPPSNTLSRSQRLQEALYSKVQVQECNLMTEPVRRGEKHYSIREESIDKDAGDFIRMRHNKFNLSK